MLQHTKKVETEAKYEAKKANITKLDDSEIPKAG